MRKHVTIYGHQFELVPLLFVTLTVAVLIFLGSWQLQRLEEKENFIKTIETNLVNPAVPIDDFSHGVVPNYSKVTISGTFLPDKNVFLYGRRSASPEKDGYYLLSAFAADNGNVYLVSRGWLAQTVKNKIGNLPANQPETIEAITLLGEKKNFFVPNNDAKNNVWFTLDLQMASEVLTTNITDFYLMQINSQTLPDGASPLRTTHLNKVRNDHLEYAITWYSLAVALVIMFIIYNTNSRN